MDDTTRYRRLVERYMNGGMERRHFLGLLGMAGLAFGIVGGPMSFLARQARAATRIRYDGWGGTVDKALNDNAFEAFTKRTGITIDKGSYGGMDEFLTKVRASAAGEYNVFFCLDQFNYKRFGDLGYASELDEKKIPNLANCIPATVELYRGLSPGGKLSSVPYVYSVTVFAYNTKHIKADYIDKAGVGALVDPQWKGKLAGEDSFSARIWFAALQTGQNPNDIKDMNVVWEKIRQSKDLVLKYWKSGAEQMSLFANEEIWISDAWSGRVAVLERQGHPVKSVVPKGARSYVGNMYVIKGSPSDAAHELLNALLEPEASIAVSKAMAYPTVIDPTKFKIPDEISSLPGFDPTGKFAGLTLEDPNYWTKNAQDWQRQYQRVVTR